MGATTRDERDDPLGALVAAFRAVLVLAGVVATLPVVASLALRQVDVTSPRLVAYVAATPVVVPVGVGAVVLFVLGGSRAGTAVAAVLTSILALTQVPLYLGTAAPADGATALTVMTVNMQLGQADAATIVAVVRERGVDVLATQELTNPAVAALRAAGIDDLLPHRVLSPGGSRGNGLWSRRPARAARPAARLRERARRGDAAARRRVVARGVRPPGVAVPRRARQWSAEMGLVAEWLDDVDRPAVVAGDFNATPDHRQFRDVLAAGFETPPPRPAPAGCRRSPPTAGACPLLITIDHVLANDGIVATDVERLEIADTDHAALVVRLAVPPGV